MKISSMEIGDGSVPVLGLGTWQLKGNECVNTVKKAIELGYSHIDTAEEYRNEEEIGKAIFNFNRDELFITSKVWPNHFEFKKTIKACNNSLERLKTDYIDLYLMHWPKTKIPFEETLKAMQKLKEGGKIKHIGVSNFDIKQLKKAMESGVKIANNQVEFHPGLYQKDLLGFCKENNITVTAYSPIARGKVFEMKTIKEIAEKYEKTEAQVSLRWLLQKGTIVIPKASSKQHLKENMAIFDWKLEKEDIQKIDDLGNSQRLITL